MTGKAHTFDWHAENDQGGGRGTFLAWAFINFAGFSDLGQGVFEELSDRSEKFKRVELGITVNGIEMDAKAFMERLEQAVDWAVEREAKKLVKQGVPELEQLQETIGDLDQALKRAVVDAAEKAGLVIEEDEWRSL